MKLERVKRQIIRFPVYRNGVERASLEDVLAAEINEAAKRSDVPPCFTGKTSIRASRAKNDISPPAAVAFFDMLDYE